MVSKFQKVVNFLYRRFVQEMGREPATTKEIMDIQNEAVRHFNKTKGVPQGAPKPSFQGFKPTVIEGGKSKEGIGTLLEDSPEAIAKMKADNKAAVERLKKKRQEAMDDMKNIEDPEDMASGGMAREGYAKGREVIEKTILSGPQKSGLPEVDKIIDAIGGAAGISTLGLPKWLISKLMQGGVRSNLAKKYNQLAKENRLRDARQLLTADNPYMGEDPSISSAKRIMREVPTAPSKSLWEIKQSLNQGGIARVGYADGSYKSEGLFGIPMEDIRKYKEREIMDRTPPFAIPDDWLEKFLKRFEKTPAEKHDEKPSTGLLKKFLRRFKKTGTYEQPMASGGIARVGYAGGRLVKGASWVINKLKEQLFDLDLGIGGSSFSKLSSTQKEMYKNKLETLIKQLEQGGEIPKEMLDTMIADPKFKSVVQTRSTDKDLFELEDALLDRQAGKVKSDDLFDAEGKLNKKAVLQEVKDSEEKMLLDRFDVKGRTKQASGGRAGSGLNYLLGEDDQNVRMPSGGLPGLLGE